MCPARRVRGSRWARYLVAAFGTAALAGDLAGSDRLLADLGEASANPIPPGVSLEGLTLGAALARLARPDLLGLDLVVTARSPRLGEPAPWPLVRLSLGEAFRLLVQLTGARIERLGTRGLVLADPGDPRRFGLRRPVLLRPLSVLPSRLIARIRESPELSTLLPPDRLSADDSRGTLFGVLTSGEERDLRELEASTRSVSEGRFYARLPVSHLDEAGLRSALARLEGDGRPLPSFAMGADGRSLVVHATPEGIARMEAALGAVDLARRQVRVTLTGMEVEASTLSRLGLEVAPRALAAQRLSDLVRLRGLSPPRVGGTVSWLMQALGARSETARTLVVQDGASSRIQLGQTRNVRTSAAAVGAGGFTATSGVAEVFVGLEFEVSARVHADGSATLDLSLIDERPLAVRPDGVDRTTTSLSTRVHARPGDPIVVSGFSQGADSRSGAPGSTGDRRGARSVALLLIQVAASP